MKKFSNTSHSSRTGSTLTEVLIAMIVLGVGAVSVMTLFPVATLRAVKSNQITQSTILRYEAEALVGSRELAFYELFFGPNREPGDAAGVPIGIEPGPNGLLAAPYAYDNFPRFNMNLFNPRRFTLSQFNNLQAAGGTVDDFNSIVIDPLGFYRMGGDVDAGSNSARLFGTFEPEVINNPDMEPLLVLPRVTGGHRANSWNTGNDSNGYPWNNRFTETEARALVTLPDQFSTLVDAHVTASNGYNSVTLNNKVDANIMDDLAGFVDSGNVLTVALVDLNGKVHMRDVSGSTAMVPAPTVASGGRVIGFETPLPDDPNNAGNPIPIDRAIVQQRNSDFTWMISARVELPQDVSMDVVVFFKRAYAEKDERLFYTIVLDSSGKNGGIETIYNKVRVEYSGDKPFAKEGGYMFDTQNNRWYRILEITADSETSTPKYMELLLDRSVHDDDLSLRITSAFPRGVIDVFPIGKKTSVYNVNP